MLVGLGASAARAQVRPHRSVAPATGVGGALDARYQQAGDIGGSDLQAAQVGLLTDAHWAPGPAVELGAGWGVRASVLSIQGLGSRTRVGAPPLRLWAGTGTTLDRWAVGVRLATGASFALVGLDAASSNGEHAFAELEGAAAHGWDALLVEARIAPGAAYAGDTALSGVVRTALVADLGTATWSVRPLVGAAIAWATDLGWGGELAVGGTIPVGLSSVQIVIGVRPWRDPTAERLRLTLSWHLNVPETPSPLSNSP